MPNPLKKFARRTRDFLTSPILERAANMPYPDVASQIQLQLTYRQLKESGKSLPALDQVGFKAFSQGDEDGILLYIFSIIGVAVKKSVEICAGHGMECNTANLLINHGWHGLLVDGNQDLVNIGRDFYKRNPSTYVYPPVFVHSWITRGNVNELIKSNGFEGEIDLLSVDMDGMDYWIWSAIDCVQPRVVVVEYQDILGPEKSVTVPYSDAFNAHEYPTTLGMPNFCGASLAAFVKLAKTKGYRLVGCNSYGYNAFFIKNPLGEKEIPVIDIRECFKHPKCYGA